MFDIFKSAADAITYDLLGLKRGGHFSDSLNFFLYDIPKIYFLIITVIFVVAVIRTYLPPERIKKILSGKGEFAGNILASIFGIFMPFCTCSAIPIFLGMLEAGIPLGVTMSFLISSPTINEIAVVMLLGMFGWKVMFTYIISGLTIATLAGFFIGKLKLEKYVDEKVSLGSSCAPQVGAYNSFKDRIAYAFTYSIDTFKWIWLYVMAGIAVGALIHGYVPADFLTTYAGRNNPFAVILAVILGVPVYANCAGAIPVAQALMAKGLPIGTSLAFLMAVSGLSLPEFLILNRVLKPRLLLTFFVTVAIGIVLTGYLFNFLF